MQLLFSNTLNSFMHVVNHRGDVAQSSEPMQLEQVPVKNLALGRLDGVMLVKREITPAVLWENKQPNDLNTVAISHT